VVVIDEVLTRCISELCTLFGDIAKARRYIRTIPKRWYSLLLPVETPVVTSLMEREKSSEKKDSHTNRFVVVLPLVNLSSDKDDDYFRDVLTEELINALTQIT